MIIDNTIYYNHKDKYSPLIINKFKGNQCKNVGATCTIIRVWRSVPLGPPSINTDTHDTEKLLLKTQVSEDFFIVYCQLCYMVVKHGILH